MASLANIAALRANATSTSDFIIDGYSTSGDGGGGLFIYVAADTTSADDGGTIIVDSAGHRYYRQVDNYVSVKMFGAVADNNGTAGNGTDNYPAFSSAAAFAQAQGKDLFVPAGKYRLSQGFSLSNTSDTSVLNPRPSLRGEGARATILVFDNAATTGLTISGTNANSVTTYSEQSVKGIMLYKGFETPSFTGTGLVLVALAHVYIEDVIVYQWNIGMDLSDVQESTFTNIACLFNATGFSASRNSLTQPNALTFVGCTFGGNGNYGVDILDPANATFIGGSIESNGGAGTASPQWGVRIVYTSTTVVESNLGASFNGVYFERNAGNGDIYLANAAVPATITVQGCNFNRGLNTNGGTPVAGTSCVYIETSGGYNTKVNLLGNGFGGLPRSGSGAWVPSASTPYVTVVNPTQPTLISSVGNRWTDSVETPNFFDGGMFAAMYFNPATATVSRSNNSSLVKNATGDYTLTFPYPGNGPYLISYAADIQGNLLIYSYTTTSLRLRFINPSGILADPSNLSVSVWN